jgi:hypothetical protein
MFNLLYEKSIQPNGTLLTNKQILYNLSRSITYMLNGLPKRPSINSLDKIPENVHFVTTNNMIQNIKYNLLVNESVQIVASNFHKWFKERQRLDNETLRVIFQIACACYAMSLSHMVHNNLHTANVFVETFAPEDITYIINDKPYTFMNIIHHAKIFSYSRSYVESIGNNNYLNSELCTDYSQCNEYIPTKDIVKLLGYILSAQNVGTICDILCVDNTYHNKLIEIYNEGSYLKHKGITLKSTDYSMFNSMDVIISKIASYLTQDEYGVLLSHPSSIPKENTYICNKNMFKSDGSLK